jgi:hypothetical protein
MRRRKYKIIGNGDDSVIVTVLSVSDTRIDVSGNVRTDASGNVRVTAGV